MPRVRRVARGDRHGCHAAPRADAPELSELRGRQGVAVWIAEPGDLVVPRCGPHAERVLVHAVEALELDPGLAEGLHRSGDVVDSPTGDRVASRRQFGDGGDTEHGAVGVEDTGDGVLLRAAKPQRVLVE